MKKLILLALFLMQCGLAATQTKDQVFMANGIKIGACTQTTAVIWTRLTEHPEYKRQGIPFPAVKKRDASAHPFPPGKSLGDMYGSVPGISGSVRVRYWIEGQPDSPRNTGWRNVEPDRDCTRQFELEALAPGKTYRLVVEGRPLGKQEPSVRVQGRFQTPPGADTPASVSFCVVTGQDYQRRDDEANGHAIYRHMRALEPSFFVHTGDIVYYDKPIPYAVTPSLARYKWNLTYAFPLQRDFHNHVTSYFIKDDHDTLKNDAWPGQTYGELTWAQGLALFREQLPIPDPPYFTVRWGKDLQIWIVEGREYRSANRIPDGPQKTIWGPEQKKWFFDTVKASDATFRVLVSPTPIVGPDRTNKGDNHANRAFAHEGNELRRFIAGQKDMYVVCGDRHWQYASVDPETGVKEFSCGPTTNKHAGGWSNDKLQPMHSYLNVTGGFLRVATERTSGSPRIAFQHYDVDGQLLNQVTLAETKSRTSLKRTINPPAAADPDKTVALVGARLIDGRGGRPIENAAVVVRGTKIVAAGSRDKVSIPQEAPRVDVDGMSILPGLIDSHFHSKNNVQRVIDYELRRGVTSLRDPGHPFHFYDAVMQSDETLPRVFLCGGHLDGPPPVWPDQAVLIRDEHHARQAVHDHVDRGASAIKVYFRLPIDHIRAACAAARERGVLVTAHLELVDADDAIRAGVRGIEHVTSFGTALAEPEAAEHFRSSIFADSNARRKLRHWLWADIDLDASQRVKPLLDLIVREGVFVSPTIAIFERRPGQKNATDEEARGFANMLRFITLCHEAGAKMVVGSHTHAPFAERGWAYQREMELLGEAGMTPLEVIRAATLNNAQFFGIDERLGTIEVGKTADLILVEGDPSVDIAAMRNVRHVMLNGVWVGERP